MGDRRFVEVAPSLPLAKTFHYQVPEELRDHLEIGKRVLVPLGKRRITGYVLSFPQEVEAKDLKDVLNVLDEFPLFSKDELNFYRWVSDYYFSSLSEAIRTALPKGINVETLQTLSITQKGSQFLARSNHDSPAHRILKETSEKKGVTLRHLAKSVSGYDPYSLVFKLRNEGLISIESKERGGRVSPKTERFVKYEGDSLSTDNLTSVLDLLEKKAAKQASIFKFIRDKETVSFRMLKEEFGNSLSSVKRLQEKGLISVFHKEVYRDPIGFETCDQDSPPRPTKEQQQVLDRVVMATKSGRFSPFLLHGVTGSGKTEIYLRSIEEVITLGKEAIVLVPEISMTPQLVTRFRSRFGNNIAVLHSGLSEGERYDEWRRIKKRDVKIAVGVRSAIFTPFENVGIIIVDEEYDTSYKQEEKLRYSARDLAMVRGKRAKAVVILGSATPSMESYYNLQMGKLTRLGLSKRIDDRPLPSVEVVDMKQETKENADKDLVFSKRLEHAIKETLTRKEQVLLFLNRRGFATFAICGECGSIIRCPNCSVSLVHHHKGGQLRCHYCDFRRPMSNLCPECRKPLVQSFGLGTERVEEEVKGLFPGAKVARMDRDTTTRKKSHHKILKKFDEGEIDVLIGTQMITKGHDLPMITLVGVISADTSLGFPDFRASERTFQLLTQVAGRAGRGDLPGKVIVQTFNPGHYSVQQARLHDFVSFYKQEIAFRRELNYPPFCRLINLKLMGKSKRKTEEHAEELGAISKDLLETDGEYRKHIEILGPVIAPLERLRGKYRWQMLIKGKKSNLLHSFVRRVLQDAPLRMKGGGVTLSVDVDPINML